MAAAARVRPGEEVLLVTSGGTYVFAEASSGSIRVNREKVEAAPLIGAVYGTRFEVRGGALVKAAARSRRGSAGTTRKRDNRSLQDDNQAQRVEAEEIKRMRVEGASGEAIIETLIEGSATWEDKTEFSKDKWLRRKERKYLPWVRVLRPTGANVAAAYFARRDSKRLALRPDALAQILARADARDGSHVVLVDATAGVVAGAFLERIAPSGRLLLPAARARQNLDALRRFNFPPDCLSLVHHVDTRDFPDPPNALVLVTTALDPVSLLDAYVPHLRPSSPFVVYADTPHPLALAFQHLRDSARATALHLSETWLRDFQVLPGRTHPSMSMSATGGFLLSGITLAAATSPDS